MEPSIAGPKFDSDLSVNIKFTFNKLTHNPPSR